MVNRQAPIGSGFGASTTSREVLAGRDLTGKLAIVTGGYSGLGLETTRALAGAGANILVAARRGGAARAALDGIPGVEVDELDLSDLDSVRGFAERFVASGRHADIVINSAGIMACPETRIGPGWEAQFAINHLGHYALVNHLWPALAGGAPGDRGLFRRASQFGDPLGRSSLQTRLRQVAGLRPVEDGQRALRSASRHARPRRRRAGLLAPSRQHIDAAATPPEPRRR